jgi:hypothetical protein
MIKLTAPPFGGAVGHCIRDAWRHARAMVRATFSLLRSWWPATSTAMDFQRLVDHLGLNRRRQCKT